MHEISIAQSILETVKKSIVNLNVTKINKIYISIGVLSGVEKEALLYCFNLIPKDKLFKNAKLIITENVLVIYCPVCKIETSIKNGFILKCAKCGKLTPQIIKGKELTIDKIEY